MRSQRREGMQAPVVGFTAILNRAIKREPAHNGVGDTLLKTNILLKNRKSIFIKHFLIDKQVRQSDLSFLRNYINHIMCFL
jgi:hypothetical protein